jgi:hypothetical protein
MKLNWKYEFSKVQTFFKVSNGNVEIDEISTLNGFKKKLSVEDNFFILSELLNNSRVNVKFEPEYSLNLIEKIRDANDNIVEIRIGTVETNGEYFSYNDNTFKINSFLLKTFIKKLFLK